jgi:hydrogenase maturation factor
MLADAEEFEKRILITEAAGIAWKGGALAMHDVSSGGIFAALWELGEYLKTGFEAGLRSILLRQETVEICEYLGLNPYQLYGQGSLLITAETDASADKIIRGLAQAGIRSAVIGRTVRGARRILTNGEDSQYLEKPQQDMLAKLADNEYTRSHES